MKKLTLGCFFLLSTLFFFNSCSKDKDDEASVSTTADGTTTTSSGTSSSSSSGSHSTTDVGVVINGVKWATRNVDAPGTFATNPEDAGMFYQWNSKVGWPSTGDIGSITATDGTTAWNSSWTGGYTNPSSSDTWTAANDPSPAGWRVPTKAEIDALCNNAKVTQARTTQNGVYGEEFTDKANGNTLFVPTCGCRAGNAGRLDYAGDDGVFWSSTASDSRIAYNLCDRVYADYQGNYGSHAVRGNEYRAYGLAVRSVLK